MSDSTDPADVLTPLARRLMTTLMTPRMIRLRRLVISNAGQFPELGRTWYEQGFERVLATIAERFEELDDRGALLVADPGRSAEHFVGMLLWIPLNKAMFTGEEKPFTRRQLEAAADAAVRSFLAAHRPVMTAERP